ncbi:MAG: sodium:proton exchanger [Deltaproteobacteria bacterium]|uniref:sodium:proton exchanger n=1 Tax=Desulfobacula sp. TaxID=2593537 RepID=UPI001988D74C|nr:sodium:proton exchanger [Candidatus Desulfobacula maris]MBL6995045.1 sodium:proton exchanger [Desulfobacula sp.]
MKQFLVNSVGRLDMIIWILVVVFFCGSALIFNGNLNQSFIAAGGIVLVMILIALSVEVIIETLKDVKGIGTITGFITNGPELVCLIVGLVVGDVLFAASTPLGSNFINPILLLMAALVCGVFLKTLQTNWRYSLTCILLTAGLAISFFFIPAQFYAYWSLTGLIATLVLFFNRPLEKAIEKSMEEEVIAKWNIIPASIVLIVAGYFLDPVVSFASEQSQAPKGVIGFFVLATLTSWPEFKSCLALLNRKKYQAAILNITVSNITNIWLAIAGVATYFFITAF